MAADRPLARTAALVEDLRAVGLLSYLPLLYTMEMWTHSFLLPSWKVIVLLSVAFVVVIGYSVERLPA